MTTIDFGEAARAYCKNRVEWLAIKRAMTATPCEYDGDPDCQGPPDAVAVDPDLWRRIKGLLTAIADGGTGWVISNKAIEYLAEIGHDDGA